MPASFSPANTSVPTGAAHWHTLVRARAIEASAFVVAAAQVGEHADGRKTYGHSVIVDPWGAVLAEAGDSEDAYRLAIAPIAPSAVARARGAIPLERSRHVRSAKFD